MPLIPSPSHNASHSLLVRPDVRFATQHKEEHVILVVRKYPLTQFSWITNAVLFLVLLLVFNLVVSGFLAPGQVILINVFGLFFTFNYVWVNYLLWYFTVGIVTDKRIIDLDFYNILYKEFAATSIGQVSEISMQVGGFIGSIFNYGNVYIKTEGFAQNIEFDAVANPSEVVKIINNLMPQGRPGRPAQPPSP